MVCSHCPTPDTDAETDTDAIGFLKPIVSVSVPVPVKVKSVSVSGSVNTPLFRKEPPSETFTTKYFIVGMATRKRTAEFDDTTSCPVCLEHFNTNDAVPGILPCFPFTLCKVS